MNSVSTSAAAGGVVGALTVLIVYSVQGFGHVTVPAEVAASLMVVLSPVVHYLAIRWGVEPTTAAVPVTPPTPPTT